jgi:hypothetical protein
MPEKKFRVLRIIGTVWKVMAWIQLVLGLILSVIVLLVGIFSTGMLRQFADRYQEMPLASQMFGLPGGIVGFIVGLVLTVIYFLMIYAVGDLIYLLVAIEENTRLATMQLQRLEEPEAEQPAAPAYAPPAAPAYTPPPPPPSYAPPPPPPPPISGSSEPEPGPTEKMG